MVIPTLTPTEKVVHLTRVEADLKARVAAVLEVHMKHRRRCAGCGDRFPCPTRRILEGK